MATGRNDRPLLGMLIDRTSFDETDEFDIDKNALQVYDEERLQSSGPVVLPNGMVRRRMRWRAPRLRMKRGPSSGMSVISQVSKTSKKSAHSFASTETQQQSNTAKGKKGNLTFSRPRPNYPDHFAPQSGKNTIGTEGNYLGAKMAQRGRPETLEIESMPARPVSDLPQSRSMQSQSFDPYHSRMEGTSTPEPEIPSVQGALSGVETVDLSPALPILDASEDRRVDLRINLTPRRSAAPMSRPPRPVASTPKVFRDPAVGEDAILDALEDSREGSSTPETAPCTDDDESVDSLDQGREQTLDELRFSMNDSFGDLEMPSFYTEDDDSTYSKRNPQEPYTESKPRTGPVDVDDGSFLEVEKNLRAIHTMATEHLQQKEFYEALEVFEEIYRGQLTRYGPTHPRVGTAVHNIGVVHANMRNFEKATKFFKEAIRIRKATLGADHADVAVSLAQLGVVCLERRKFRKALLAFRESLKIRRALYGNKHPKVAKILNNVGCALYELNELDVARVAFEEGLKIQRCLLKITRAENSEVSRGQLLGIASTQSNLASIKLLEGHYMRAALDFEEALLLQECVLPEDHPIVEKTRASLRWIEQHGEEKEEEDEEQVEEEESSANGSVSGRTTDAVVPDFVFQMERKLSAFRDMACGACPTEPEDQREESSSIRGRGSF